MKKLLDIFFAFVVASLVACGGGGGSAGGSSTTTSGTSDAAPLKVSVRMLDASGAEVANRTIPPDVKRSIVVSVTDAKGVAVSNALVKVDLSQDASFVTISGSSSGLTSGGAITFYVEMSGERKNGAATLNISVQQAELTSTIAFAVQTTGGTGVGVATGGLSIGLGLVNQSGVEIASRSISQTTPQSLRVLVRDAANQPQPFAFVTLTFSKGDDLVKVVGSSGSKLTDANGVALFALAPKSVASSGAVEAKVDATSGAVSASAVFTMQTEIGQVQLGTVSVLPSTVQKGASTLVEVPVTLNGAIAPSNSVSVDFNSNCGIVTPASALVGDKGLVSAVIQTQTSGVSCRITVTASGASTVVGTYAVTDPPVSALRFVKADPEVIYQANSPGATSSLVTFRLVDTVGNPVSGRGINATLSNADGGIVFCDSSPQSTTSPRKVTSNGEVTFAVCSGTLPTTMVVKASLDTAVGESPVESISNILTVQTGLPSQRFFDISATSLNIYAGAGSAKEGTQNRGTSYFSGKSTDINVYLADRLANPVPNGTPVVFVAEGGQINSASVSSCVLKDGGCTVKLIGQEFRPWGSGETGADARPGRVTVLAYADGQEAFVDTNQNNRYDLGEVHEELGRPFIDLDENGTFQPNAITQLVRGGSVLEQSFPLPAGVEGTDDCSSVSQAGVDHGLSVDKTCNKKWDSFTKVRRKIIIVFSGGEIGVPTGDGTSCVNGTGDKGFNLSIPCDKRTRMITTTSSLMTARISDYNGNPLPADATLSYEVSPVIDGCEVTPLVSGNYGNTTEPIDMSAALKNCASGSLAFKVTVDGKTTSFDQAVPGAPTVTSHSPVTATLDSTEIFTFSGSNLGAGMAFSVTNCSNVIDLGGSSQSRKFSCKLGLRGAQTLQVRSNSGGLLYTGTVTVAP